MNRPSERSHPAWKIWSNPIFRRYCRSRLRPRGLIISLLLTLILAIFIFSLARTVGTYQAHLSPTDAERGPLVPLLVLQSVILFILGTAQVGGGMTAERDEGVIDYQRLIPMSPLAKVMGYIFGLPIREYVMVAATLPFTIWALWKGKVAMAHWLPIYAVFFSSALLYHFTGLVTGTVVKNRRWAFLVSIGLVFCLYTVIPQMAKFGLVFFEYLTITPVITEQLAGILPKDAAAVVKVGQQLAPSVKFFNLDFSETVFTIFTQGGLIVTFIAMLCRRWRRVESHLLGKLWATLFFIWIQILLLGNALPLVETGRLFPSRELSRYVDVIRRGWTPQPEEAVGMSGLYGLVTLLILFLLSGMITPSGELQVKGWRRARKRGATSLPLLSDAATGFGFTAVMALAGAVGWYLFTRGLVESRWFEGQFVPLGLLGYFIAVMLAFGLGFQVLLELKGGRLVGLMVIFIGVLPILTAAVLGTIGKKMLTITVWLAALSPVSAPMYASHSLLSLAELPPEIARAVPRAFQFWLLVYALVTLWLIVKLWAERKAKAKSVMGEV